MYDLIYMRVKIEHFNVIHGEVLKARRRFKLSIIIHKMKHELNCVCVCLLVCVYAESYFPLITRFWKLLRVRLHN